MRLIRSLLAGLVVGGLVSCGDLTEPEPLPTLEIVDGFGQEGLGNETLRDSLRVRLISADGTPVPGATVVWTVSSGAISPVQTVTDGAGQAAASWSFYNAATRWWSSVGTHLATATVAGGDSVMFTGHAKDGVVLYSVSIAPDQVDVSSGDAPVTVTVRVTNDLTRSTVDFVSVQFYNPTANSTVFHSLVAGLKLVSGTPADGVWQEKIIVPQGAETGVWTLGRLTLSWGCGSANRDEYLDGDLRAGGMPYQLTVTAASSQPDVLPGRRPSEASLRPTPSFAPADESLRLSC